MVLIYIESAFMKRLWSVEFEESSEHSFALIFDLVTHSLGIALLHEILALLRLDEVTVERLSGPVAVLCEILGRLLVSHNVILENLRING